MERNVLDRQIVLGHDLERHDGRRGDEQIGAGLFDVHARRLIGHGANLVHAVLAAGQAFGVDQLERVRARLVDDERFGGIGRQLKSMTVGGQLARQSRSAVTSRTEALWSRLVVLPASATRVPRRALRLFSTCSTGQPV